MIKVRNGVFETNSSSVHSMIMCSEDEYEMLENKEYLIDFYKDMVISKEEVINRLKEDYDVYGISEDEFIDILHKEGYWFLSDYRDNNEHEGFFQGYTTNSGEKVYAFGYYGYDG